MSIERAIRRVSMKKPIMQHLLSDEGMPGRLLVCDYKSTLRINE
jgi:hypothetical protein